MRAADFKLKSHFCVRKYLKLQKNHTAETIEKCVRKSFLCKYLSLITLMTVPKKLLDARIELYQCFKNAYIYISEFGGIGNMQCANNPKIEIYAYS